MKRTHRFWTLILAGILLLTASAASETALEPVEEPEMTCAAALDETDEEIPEGATASCDPDIDAPEAEAEAPEPELPEAEAQTDDAPETEEPVFLQDAPTLSAPDAAPDEYGVWRFDAAACGQEIRFVLEGGAVQAYTAAITDESGAAVYAGELSGNGLVLPLGILEVNVLYELRVSAPDDPESAPAALTFVVVSAEADEAPEETGAEEADDEMTDETTHETTDETTDVTTDETAEEATDAAAAADTVEDSDGATSADTDSEEEAEDETSGSGKSSKKSSSGKSSSSKSSSGSSGKSSSGKSSSSGGKKSSSSKSSGGKSSATVDAGEELDLNKIDIALDAGEAEFDIEQGETTLRFAPSGHGSVWSVGEGALDDLYASGIETLEFLLADKTYTLRLGGAEDEGAAASSDEDGTAFPSPALRIDADGVTVVSSSLQFTIAPDSAAKEDE